MEMLSYTRQFLSVGYGDGYGYGFGDGDCYGYGFGSGDGSGDGSGYGFGDGDGYGFGFGDGDGDCDGSGDGYGSGNCDGSGDGYGSGNCDGYGDGYGSGNCDGYGSGDGYGIGEFNSQSVHYIDGVSTLIDSVHGNIAKGCILQGDFTLTPCYVAKNGNKFAHGATLHEAYAALQEKLYDDSTEEERLNAFKAKFPEYVTPYSNADIFTYHHVLTGSCKQGRESFAKDHGLTLDGTMTVREFVALTKDSYGGDIIKKLPNLYNT